MSSYKLGLGRRDGDNRYVADVRMPLFLVLKTPQITALASPLSALLVQLDG